MTNFYTDEEYKEIENYLKGALSEKDIQKTIEQQGHWYSLATQHDVFVAHNLQTKKAEMELKRAELYLNLKHNGEKMTENHISMKIESSAEYCKLKNEYLEILILQKKIDHLKNLYEVQSTSVKNFLKYMNERNMY